MLDSTRTARRPNGERGDVSPPGDSVTHSVTGGTYIPPLALMILLGLLIAPLTAAAERFPPELTRFQPISTEPLFTGAGEGHWDVRIRERGAILHENGVWKLWYTGYDGTRPGLKMLGYATSTDGLTWTRHAGNPIYREHWIEDVCVLKHEGKYYLFAEGFLDQAHWFLSKDGLSWERQGLLDVRLKNGAPVPAGPLGTPCVWVENGVWYLFYERRDAGVWLATSTDLKIWTNVQDEPVLSPGPDLYDRDLIAMNQIVRHNGRYYAVFHGASKDQTPNLWSTGLAVSDDLIHWDKYAGNPLRPITENKSSGQLFRIGDRWRLYTVHDRVVGHESGKVERSE